MPSFSNANEIRCSSTRMRRAKVRRNPTNMKKGATGK
jgi:hypothetical protein